MKNWILLCFVVVAIVPLKVSVADGSFPSRIFKDRRKDDCQLMCQIISQNEVERTSIACFFLFRGGVAPCFVDGCCTMTAIYRKKKTARTKEDKVNVSVTRDTHD